MLDTARTDVPTPRSLHPDPNTEFGDTPIERARSAKTLRQLAKKLLDPLALGLLDGRFSDGDAVLARLIEGEISLEKLESAAIAAA